MRNVLRTAALSVGALAAAAAIYACSDATVPTTAAVVATGNPTANTDTWRGEVEVCKIGPVGTYNFEISSATTPEAGDFYYPFGQTFSITVTDPSVYSCLIAWRSNSSTTPDNTVTVHEILPSNMEVSAIMVKHEPGGEGFFFPGTATFTVPNTTPDNYGNVMAFPGPGSNAGYIIKFTNMALPPSGGNGCTPGYWKQTQHFDAWVPTGLNPNQTIGSVFSNASIYGYGSLSLVQGLNLKGGSTLAGAAQILLRAAIAAELNARYPGNEYPLTASAIVSAVNTALASANRETMLTLATSLDTNNNLGCWLN